MEHLQEEDDEIQIHLRLILTKLELVLDRIDSIYTPITTKWLSEENTMKVFKPYTKRYGRFKAKANS